MQYVIFNGKKLDFDYALDNNNSICLFKYSSKKKVKRELYNIFDTNNMVILENRLKKYNLKLELIYKTSHYCYFEIKTLNLYGAAYGHKFGGNNKTSDVANENSIENNIDNVDETIIDTSNNKITKIRFNLK